MIKSIAKVKGFGSYETFFWPSSLPGLKQKNIFYGWNYSGKTTISRILRCMEFGNHHPDYLGATAEIEHHDGRKFQIGGASPNGNIRVFNTDFIRENLSFDTSSASAILIVGHDDITRRASLSDAQSQIQVARDRLYEINKIGSESETFLSKSLTEYARDKIKIPLGIPDYDKKKFEPKVASAKNVPSAYKLSDQVLSDLIATYQRRNPKESIPSLSFQHLKCDQLESQTGQILRKVVGEATPIERLSSDSVLEAWIRDGLTIHDGKLTCQFCEQALPGRVMEAYQKHFSDEYENLILSLQKLAHKIVEATKITLLMPAPGAFEDSLVPTSKTLCQAIELCLENRQNQLADFSRYVDEKKSKAFTVVTFDPLASEDTRLEHLISELNGLISRHNQIVKNFDSERRRIFNQIELHYAADYVTSVNLVAAEIRLEELDLERKRLGQRIGELDSEIMALESELSEAQRGSEKLNETLARCFSKADLKMRLRADGRFEITRNGLPAKNLSEGERTTIAFAYFSVSAHSGRTEIGELILVIDDPISSLDANHLFNVYATVKTELAAAKQLIVLTHSFEFFSLLKDWATEDEKEPLVKRPQSSWKHWAIYWVSRSDSGVSSISEIDRTLLKFKSEYHFLFHSLISFSQDPQSNIDRLLTLPNIARRFVEAFGGVMIPNGDGLKKKLERLIADPVQRVRVYKFINSYSHNTTMMRSLCIPDASECKAVVDLCLEMVENWNSTYYADLLAEVS